MGVVVLISISLAYGLGSGSRQIVGVALPLWLGFMVVLSAIYPFRERLFKQESKKSDEG